MIRTALFVLSTAVAFAQDNTFCDNGTSGWTDDDQKDFVRKMLWGAIVGILLGVVMVVLASMPLCCGIMKGPAKIIAGLAIGLGFLACICKNCHYTGGSCMQSQCAGCDPTFESTMR